MTHKTVYGVALILGVLASTSVLADHNSVNGAGWANMPNDIHNTRLEDNLSQTEWRDFVSKGAGADTVNRYTTDADVARGARTAASGDRAMAGSARGSRR